jgi:hypothetical protein
MAKRRQIDNQLCIVADNGFGWAPERSSVLSVQFYCYTTEIFGVRYRLEKFLDPDGDRGWYLYSVRPAHFMGEYCDKLLLSAIDVASEMIDKADLRGEGYGKEAASDQRGAS